MDAATFLEICGGIGLVVSASIAFSQIVSARIQLQTRRDIIAAREDIAKNAAEVNEIKINTKAAAQAAQAAAKIAAELLKDPRS
jgi:hypothetical protein